MTARIPHLFRIEPDQRVAIFGASGTGKSTTAAFLLRWMPGVVIWDTKGSESLYLPEFERIGPSLHDLDRIFAPENLTKSYVFTTPDILDTKKLMEMTNTFLRFLYENVSKERRKVVYIDELAQVANASVYPEYLRAAQTRGREKGLGTWTGSQRPRKIPLEAISEANHYILHAMNLKADRKHIEEAVEMPVAEAIANLGEHEFYYAHPRKRLIRGPYEMEIGE